jgi:hypothetical protein
MQADRSLSKPIKTPADMRARQVAKKLKSQNRVHSFAGAIAVFSRCLCSDGRELSINEKAGLLMRMVFLGQGPKRHVFKSVFKPFFAPKFLGRCFLSEQYHEHHNAIDAVFGPA